MKTLDLWTISVIDREVGKEVPSSSDMYMIECDTIEDMKETLKYLKEHATKKTVKEPIFGELWELLNSNEKVAYEGELLDFEIDNSVKNIFIAA